MNTGTDSSPNTLYSGRFLQMLKEGRWEYVQRINSDGAVMIIALTPEEELLLVEEYRVPLHMPTIGLPAGIAGDDGPESTLQAAVRELEEETGYRAAEWTYLFTGPSSPGLTSEMISYYIADDLTQVSAGGGVDNENITVHKLPLAEAHEWLMRQLEQGKLVDPRVFMALYFISLRKS